MKTATCNSFGLYDAPVRFLEKERITLTQADIKRQIIAGAFILDRAEAIAAGFINSQNEPDTVIVEVRRGNV